VYPILPYFVSTDSGEGQLFFIGIWGDFHLKPVNDGRKGEL